MRDSTPRSVAYLFSSRGVYKNVANMKRLDPVCPGGNDFVCCYL